MLLNYLNKNITNKEVKIMKDWLNTLSNKEIKTWIKSMSNLYLLLTDEEKQNINIAKQILKERVK